MKNTTRSTLSIVHCALCIILAAPSALATGTWYDASWKDGFTPAEGNILIYRTPDPATGLDQREGTLGYDGLTDGEGVKNNKAKTTALADNASLTYTLAKATAIDEVRVYSTWGGNARSFVSIASIQIVTYGGETNTIGDAHRYVDYASACSFSTLKMADGSPLCEDAHKIVFNFGTQDYGYNGYAELEVVGHAVEGVAGIPHWSTGSWKDSGFTAAPAEDNLILGKDPSQASGWITSVSPSYWTLTDGNAVTNILSETTCLGNNDSIFVTYTLDAESVINEVRIYSTANNGYRDELRVASIMVETLDGATSTISPAAVSSYDAWLRGCPYAVLKMTDGSPLCTNAVRITINFGPQKSGYVFYSELEVLGRVAEGGVYLPQWRTGSWKDSGFTAAPAEDNLILGKDPSQASGRISANWASPSYSVLTDGNAVTNVVSATTTTCLGNNDSIFVTYTLDAESVINEVRIYSTATDSYRDELRVESIVIETRGGATYAISPGAVSSYDAWPRGCPYAVLKKANGSPLCTDAVRITINFGQQKNGFVNYSELEVLGHAAEGGMSMPEWVTSSWKEGFTRASAATNLIFGKTPSPASGITGNKQYSSMTDGIADVADYNATAWLVDKASVTYTLDAPSVIEEVRVFCTSGTDNWYRNYLHVSSVVVETPSGATYTISPGEVEHSDSGGTYYCPAATLKKHDGSPLCRNASKITINFGSPRSSYMFFAELEVIGYANAGSVLGLAASGGAAKRILHDDFTLGLVATLGGVAGTTFDWDLDGDGVYEILGEAATMEVTFTNASARTVRVRDTSTWQVETLEIGACPPDVYVAPAGQGGDEYPYDTPATAANTPDSVWTLVIPGSRVHLLPGAYNYSFTIGQGVHLMADDPSLGATVVTNDNTRRVFEVAGEGAVISGITMSGGKVVKPSSGWANDIPATQADTVPGGACVYVHDGGTVSNCWISAPNCDLRGGAGGCIYSDNGRVVDCVIGNAILEGSANYNDIFYGLGIYMKGSDALVERCVITNIVMTGPHSHTKHKMGAAIQMTGGTVRNSLITGCRFDGATSTSGSSADRTPGILAGGGRIENCTIAGNAAWYTAAGIVTYGDATVANSIIHGNTSSTGANPDAFAFGGNGTFLRNCTGTAIGGNGSGERNFIADPRFTDAAGGDFSIARGSPCRNKADRTLYTGDLNGIDLAHASRLDGQDLDLGCYEYQNTIRPTVFIMW